MSDAKQRSSGESAAARPSASRLPVMSDVAALAGVSQMTVSRVLNDRSGVREETRQRVEAAMRQLDYHPNVAARTLVTGRSRTLGVVSFDTSFYGPARMLHGIEQAAREAGYFVSIASTSGAARRSLRGAVSRLTEQRVDGILVIAPHESSLEALQDLAVTLPLVVVESGSGFGAPLAAVDQEIGAARAVQHLLSLGHETVWHISGPSGWIEASQRRQSWQSVLVAAKRRVPKALEGDWSPQSGYEHGRTLARVREATAVFVANDQMALGLLRALREAGLRVPNDVSVVGFDDVPEAAYFAPPLTTVRQDFDELGRRSLHLLLDQLEGRPMPTTSVVIEPDLVLRESTGPVRGSTHQR